MSRTRAEKIRLITDINNILVKNDQCQLSVNDFDILYDMDIDEIMIARQEIYDQLLDIKRVHKPVNS